MAGVAKIRPGAKTFSSRTLNTASSPAAKVPVASPMSVELVANRYWRSALSKPTPKIGLTTCSVKRTCARNTHSLPCRMVCAGSPSAPSNQARTISARPSPNLVSPFCAGVAAACSRLKFVSRYWLAISWGSPMNRVRPRSMSIARSQNRTTAPMSCVTKSIVLPSSRSRWNSSKHFCWKAASPTASTSSISRTSASTWTATENASRTCMPEE